METGVTITENQIRSLNKASAKRLMQCFQINDAYGLIDFESSMTVPGAMNGTGLSKMVKVFGPKNMVKAISYLLMRLADNFNMKGKISEEQAITIANDLLSLDVFGYETIEDVVMMLKLVRQGKIGYEKDFKIDFQTVLHKWIPEYLELKAIERENVHQRKKDETKLMNNPLSSSILAAAGKEKITYKTDNSEGRHKNAIRIALKSKSDEELKNYLLENDSKSKTFDKDMYALVEQEVDFRNSQRTKTPTA